MKKIFRNMAYALLGGLMLSACSAEDFSGANGELPSAAGYDDNFVVDVDQKTNTAHFTFNSAEGVTPVWLIDGAYSSEFSLSKYYRKMGTYQVECHVRNRNGISPDAIIRNFNIEKTQMTGFDGFKEDSEFNLFKGVTLPSKGSSYYYAPGWNQIDDPATTYNKGCYTVKLPEATTERWQAQMALDNIDISTSADKKYDFSVILTSSKGHGGVKVKLCQEGDDNIVLFDKDVKLEAGEPKCLFGSELDGKDISKLKMIFDFGGNQAGDEINIESFVLKDNANNDGTVVPAELNTPFDYNSSNNLWKALDAAGSFTDNTWYGNNDWGTIEANPVITHKDGKHTIIVPVETPAAQWHAQWKLKDLPISAKADAKLDFSCRVTTTAKLPMMTMKLADNENDNNNFFFSETANDIKGEYVFRIEAQPIQGSKPGAMEKMMLVMDLAGAPKGTEVTVSDIVVSLK